MTVYTSPIPFCGPATAPCRAVPVRRAFPRGAAILIFLCATLILGGCGVSPVTSSSTQGTSPSPTKTTPSITWQTPAPIDYGTALSSAQLNATANVPGTFTYTPSAGTVPAAGTVTLSATFTPSDTQEYSPAAASVQLLVKAKNTDSPSKTTPTITWPTPAAITYGTALSSAQLDATANVPGTFAYSPTAGTVPPAGADTLTVVFTPTDTSSYNTATASVKLVVHKAASSPSKTTPTITWPTPAAITYGTALSSKQLDATANVPGTFVYSPTAGTVPPAGTDTLSVSFTPTDTSSYNTATASVKLVVNSATTTTKTTPTITWPTPAAITYGTALSSKQLDATASVPGTFVYSPAAGAVLPDGTDTLTVTFTPTDASSYNTATASVELVVKTASKTTPTITWSTPAAINSGTALSSTQLDATASVPGTFVYSPPAGTVLPVGTDTLAVVFNPTDTTTYSSAAASVQLVVKTVSKTTPTITWPTPAAINSGTALSSAQLDATASVSGTFVYSPVAGAVLPAGTDTLSVTFTPTDTSSYNSATASVELVVNTVSKTTPTITWPTPAAINSGTALSSTQLDATASVPGTFVYSPPAGTVPAAGTDTLSVTFTPTDKTTYNSATASVQLVVNAASGSLSQLTCANGTLSSAGTDSCTLGLTAPAGSSGMTVRLSSSSSAVSVPSSITVQSGATSAGFSATVSSVTTEQTVIITATTGGVTKTYTIDLSPAAPALTLQSTSVSFGGVGLNIISTQLVTLTSSGTAPLTISAGTVTGTGFSISGLTFPLTLNPGQSTTLTIEFLPLIDGSATGNVTLTDNTSAGTATIALSGVGGTATYQVNLSWDLPTSNPADPAVGFNVYRATGGGTYQLLSSTANGAINYTDTTVLNGTTYMYYVQSVDASGNQSTPSNVYMVTIPSS
jgi:Abnormal spindle-like microcephaly-assoc'd, ASPM-SPD-2-Hydin